MALVELLADEIAARKWDVGRVKVIFRALKIAKPKGAIDYILAEFSELVVFAKETCLLMEVLEDEDPGCFDELLDDVLNTILTPPASSVQLIRTWLLEIFVRGIIDIPIVRLKKLGGLVEGIDKRQLLLIRDRCKDRNYFRKQKTAIHKYSDIERSSLVLGASCLPNDEYKIWVKTLKATFGFPLGVLFLKWAVENRETLILKLKAESTNHPT